MFFKRYPLKTISSLNAAINNIMLTIKTSALNPTAPVTVIAPKTHKIRNMPPINTKAPPRPANISLPRFSTDNPISINGSLLTTAIINQIAAKLDKIPRAVISSIIGDPKLIPCILAINASAAAGSLISTPLEIIITTTPIPCTIA